MAETGKIAALIAAGGYSSRMGDFKPLLPLAGRAVIECSAASLKRAGIGDITVVVGFRADDLRPVLAACGVNVVLNEQYAEGMFSSITAGVRALPKDIDGFFFLPADMPLVTPETIAALAASFRRNKASVVYPVSGGRRGHPPLISAGLIPGILSYDGEGGLRQFLRQAEASTAEVEVDDEGIFLDADTPEDYRELCRVAATRIGE